MLLGLAFEKLDAGLIQSNGNLHGFFSVRELIGRWEKIRYDCDLAEWLIAVLGFLVHKHVSLWASIPRL